MKRYLLCAALVAAATPLQAQTAGRMSVREARPVAAGPVVAAPRAVRPDRPDRPDRQAAAKHLRHIYARAHNAIENGATPERVRAKVQEYKHHLRRRWNAASGD